MKNMKIALKKYYIHFDPQNKINEQTATNFLFLCHNRKNRYDLY